MNYYILRNNQWNLKSNVDLNTVRMFRNVKLWDFDGNGNEVFIGIGLY